ncbi:MAG TPA: SGNH/GDSL hydrolase family protein [Gaiellaceae bacterium]|nr:SGNH/GDSL hydrolase family protein [Gaiellaceae bacterium]
MSERVVLCYGDSNTYGWIPGGGRYARGTRWPGVLAAELGAGWHVIEEGLGGRTTVFEDPLLPHRNGRDYLVPCLASHEPVDLVVLYLGTNDLKARFAATAADIAAGAGALATIALESLAGPGATPPRVLVLGLPRLGRLERVEEFAGAEEKAERLPEHLRSVTGALGVDLLDLGELVACSDVDGIHLDEAAHRTIGEAVAGAVRRIFDQEEVSHVTK